MLTGAHNQIQILLVDDHSVVRTGLRMLLENHKGLNVVGEAGGVDDALKIVNEVRPDVILLDLDLGGDSGVDLMPHLLEATDNQSRVILLTGLQDPDVHREAVRRGALGLVKKDQAADTLVKAIEKVYAGEIWLERTMTANIFKEFSSATYQRGNPEELKIASLTDRERDVIGLIGEGMKNKEIADRLFISESTVRHHLTSVYDKLGVSDRLELVIYAFKHDLVELAH